MHHLYFVSWCRMQTIEKFLSCDWGTSNFRLRLIETATFTILGEQSSAEGIAATFQAWQASGEDREQFYLARLHHYIGQLEQKTGTSLSGLPVVLSGMASSTIGMTELPYKNAPFYIDGRDLITKIIKATDEFAHDIILISGATTGTDVMRGEETQMAGAFPEEKNLLIIFPGTHSKHVTVANGQVINFNTYMTGEFFELLSRKSILAASVEEGDGIAKDTHQQSFHQGILQSMQGNVLQNSFRVRTNSIFNKLSKEENYYYLSGLLIGAELSTLLNNTPEHILLVGGNTICHLYQSAIEQILQENKQYTLRITDGGEAVIKGQLRVLCQINY